MSTASQPASHLSVLVRELYLLSGAERYALSEDDFAGLLEEISVKYLPGERPADEVGRFYRSLNLEELVLARACAAGSERAWEAFLARFRSRLYEMALALSHDDVSARELADSVYADLYGVSTRDGRRVSKLSYYAGRGSLEGWLRTVLAQDFVNRCRREKRLVSLEEQQDEGEQFVAPSPDPIMAADPRVEQATDQVLAELPVEERFMLSAYFLQDRTYAEIGQILNVHESTVSRRIGRLTGRLRKAVVKRLVTLGLARRAAEEALETADVQEMRVNVRGRLQSGEEAPAGGDSAQASGNSAFYSRGDVLLTAQAAKAGRDRNK